MKHYCRRFVLLLAAPVAVLHFYSTVHAQNNDEFSNENFSIDTSESESQKPVSNTQVNYDELNYEDSKTTKPKRKKINPKAAGSKSDNYTKPFASNENVASEVYQNSETNSEKDVPDVEEITANAAPNAEKKTNSNEPESSEEEIAEDSTDPFDYPPPQDEPRMAPNVIGPNMFGGAPYVPGTRRIMAEGEAPEEYLVEFGDTLYDISDQLLAEPDYWPKLWAINPDIKNPHFIFPGMRLSFYPGDSSTPPYLTVVSEEDTIPVESGELTENELLVESVAELITKDLKTPPTEFIELDQVEVDPELANSIEIVGSPYREEQLKLQIPAFIFKKERETLGKIVAGTSGQFLLGQGTEFIVSSPDRSVQSGQAYSVLRFSGEVNNPREDSFVGYRYEFVSHIRIGRDLKDEFLAAKTIEERIPIQPGDLVVPYLSTNRTIAAEQVIQSTDSADSVVVGFDHSQQIIGGRGSYVFLDDVLPKGAAIPIYQFLQERATSAIYESLPTVDSIVAYVRIIDSTDAASVGYIVGNVEVVRLGDPVGKG